MSKNFLQHKKYCGKKFLDWSFKNSCYGCNTFLCINVTCEKWKSQITLNISNKLRLWNVLLNSLGFLINYSVFLSKQLQNLQIETKHTIINLDDLVWIKIFTAKCWNRSVLFVGFVSLRNKQIFLFPMYLSLPKS